MNIKKVIIGSLILIYASYIGFGTWGAGKLSKDIQRLHDKHEKEVCDRLARIGYGCDELDLMFD